MKKVISAANLALNLTLKTVLAIFTATALVQTGWVLWELMPGGVPLQATFGFEQLLKTAAEGTGRTCLFLMLGCLMSNAAYSKGSKSIYTFSRLGLTPMQVTFVFGGVFSLYFLLWWALQLCLCYGFFAIFSRFTLASSNTFMLAVWRSEWLHFLLPLGEWAGYLRNAVLCLSFGFSAAFGAHRRRMGKGALVCLIPPALLYILTTNGRVASGSAWLTIALLAICTVVLYFVTKEGDDHEIL